MESWDLQADIRLGRSAAIYLRGLSGAIWSDEAIAALLHDMCIPPLAVDSSQSTRKRVNLIALFPSPDAAGWAIIKLHQLSLGMRNGIAGNFSTLSVGFDLGRYKTEDGITDVPFLFSSPRGPFAARHVRRRPLKKKTGGKVKKHPTAGEGTMTETKGDKLSVSVETEYRNKSIVITAGSRPDQVEVVMPLPTGSYFTRLISLIARDARSAPRRSAAVAALERSLIAMLMDVPRIGKKVYDKEITESLGVAAAVEKAFRYLLQRPSDTTRANFYVLGDGKLPLSAAAIRILLASSARECRARNLEQLKCMRKAVAAAATTPRVRIETEADSPDDGEKIIETRWRFYSVDPVADEGETRSDLFQVLKIRSQEFKIPDNGDDVVSFVIAQHSHAPLQEFWDRVPKPKIAVVMPCCGKTWSALDEAPMFEYDDFDVFSQKRRIKIHAKLR